MTAIRYARIVNFRQQYARTMSLSDREDQPHEEQVYIPSSQGRCINGRQLIRPLCQRSFQLDENIRQTPSSGTTLPRDDHLHGINSSISATHVASSSSVLQLNYGASSNFSFLRQIHHSLSRDRHLSTTNDEFQEGGAELDLYGQRSLFFGTSDTKNHLNGHLTESPVMLLLEQVAERTLVNYISTFHQLLPFT